MKVLYFGYYNPTYDRNQILIRGLKLNGVEVIECQDKSRGLKKYWLLFKKLRSLNGKYDCIVVGFLGHMAVPLAKLISRKPVIFDAFVSLYELNIEDRKLAGKISFKALYYWFLDWFSMALADLILFDTQEHIKYASKKFGIRMDKFRRIFVGAEDDIFIKELAQECLPHSHTSVFFFGTFIPLHGIEYIVKAAKILENQSDIKFVILGGGQESEKISHLSDHLKTTNIQFINRVPIEQLAREIACADICLGIFGSGQKTRRVIPNKVFKYVAMAKPVITADTPAIKELFDDNDLVLVPAADPDSLARAILDMKANLDRERERARKTQEKIGPEILPLNLGQQLKDIAQSLIKS